MGQILDAVGLLLVVGFNTAIATVTIRFLRLRLATRLGRIVYTTVLTPPLLIGGLLLSSGVLGLGPNLGGPAIALVIGVALPFCIGVSIERFWMPPPDAVAE